MAVNRDSLKELLLIFDGCSTDFLKSMPYPTEKGPLRFGTQSKEPLVFRMDFFDQAELWFEYRRNMGHSSLTKIAEIPMPLISRSLDTGRVQIHFTDLHDRELVLLESVARVVGEQAFLNAEREEVGA